MAVQYRLIRNNDTHSSRYQKWYGRAVMIDTVDTDSLATMIEANCTVKRADVLAVVSELVVVMRQALQDSKRVKLNGFGSFKLGLTTTAADTAKEFTSSKNVKGIHVLFQPETRVGKDGKRTKTFLDGCKVAALPENAVADESDGAEAGVDGQ